MLHLTALLLATTPLSFDAALSRIEDSPGLAGVRAATVERRDALGHLSALPNNPQLTLQPGFRTLPSQPTGPEGFVSLAQTINLGGLSSARRAVATSEADASALQWESERRATRVAVARAWFDAWVARSVTHALRAERDDVGALIERLKRAVVNGAVTRIELATARTFDAELHLQLLEWEDRGIDARVRLATLLGFEEMPDVVDVLPDIAAATSDRPALTRLPHVKLLDAERALETLRGDEVAAQWASQLLVSLQFGHEWQGQWVGYAGLGFSLPVFERGQRERAAHRANARRLEGATALATRNASVEWQRIAHELEHTEEVLDVAQREQLPAATEAAELETRRYEQGEATLLDVTLLRRQAVVARVAVFIARANVLEARHRAREQQRAAE